MFNRGSALTAFRAAIIVVVMAAAVELAGCRDPRHRTAEQPLVGVGPEASVPPAAIATVEK